MSDGKTTHFGFEDIPEDEKAGRVHGVFSSVASRYDLMNDVMSAGIHRVWKDAMMDWLAPRPGQRLLDVAGGTGDIAFRFLRRAPGAEAVVLDMTEDMLIEGQRRAEAESFAASLDWIVGDAMALPFEANSFDTYTISFGIRNVTRVEDALSEAKARNGRVRGETVAEDGKNKSGMARRSIKSHATRRVADRGVRETGFDETDIFFWAHVRNRRDVGDDLFQFHFAPESGYIRIGHTVGNRFQPQQFARIGKNLMARVQNADLHCLVIVHLVCEDRTHLIPVWTPGTERVFDHPLAKIFVGDWCRVFDAEVTRRGDLCRPCRGNDAVDHGVRESAGLCDPVCESCVRKLCKPKNSIPRDMAVSAKVVTALYGERACTCVTAQAQCGDDRPKGGAGLVPVNRVVDDVRMCRIERAGCGIHIIAALSHGQGHDADRRVGHLGDERCVVRLNGDKIDH